MLYVYAGGERPRPRQSDKIVPYIHDTLFEERVFITCVRIPRVSGENPRAARVDLFYSCMQSSRV
jgi:hypothetical protein